MQEFRPCPPTGWNECAESPTKIFLKFFKFGKANALAKEKEEILPINFSGIILSGNSSLNSSNNFL